MKKIFACLLLAAVSWGCKGGDSGEGEKPTTTEDKGGEAQPAESVTIKISCGAVGKELDLCKRASGQWAEKTGNKVEVVTTPPDTNARLALYQQLLGAKASDIDVFQIDVIWPGILGNHFIDLKEHSGGAEKEHFQAIVDNNTVDGKLVAMPWFTDAGLLYYRKDLLEKHGVQPPTTWAEMTEGAKKIQKAERAAGNEQFWGFVWQGKAYEGLTCNALEWVASHGGGTIVDESGKVTINNPGAIEAIEMAASWVGTITPQGVLNYAEEEARGVFQQGNAAFMRNWPYAWSLAQGDDSPVKDKVGAMALPKGGADGKPAATLGGWQLSVSKYSKHQEAAADLVMHLASSEVQKLRAVEGSYNPTIPKLYENAEVLAANPFFGELYETFTSAVPRPSTATGAKYNQVSNEFWNAVHEVLSKKTSAADSVKALEEKLNGLSRGGTAW